MIARKGGRSLRLSEVEKPEIAEKEEAAAQALLEERLAREAGRKRAGTLQAS